VAETEAGPPAGRDPIESVFEAILAGFLPDEVRESLDGVLPKLPFGEGNPTPLQSQAMRQSGVDSSQVAVLVLKVELDALRRDIDRLEETQTKQGESALTEGQVFALVFLVVGALASIAALLAASGKL
jgi:hypothetical protein